MSASDLPELLPCPFCGSTDISLLEMHGWSNDDPAKTTTQSECRGCGTCGPEVLDVAGESDEDVERRMRSAWNTRAGDKRAREAPTDATRAAWREGYDAGMASALPSKVTPDMRRVFRQAYREGGFWSDRLDYALDQMLASAPTPGEKTLCPSCGHDVNSPLCPCDPPVPGCQP